MTATRLSILGVALGLLAIVGYFVVVFVAGAWLPGVRNGAVPNLVVLAVGLGCSLAAIRRPGDGGRRLPRALGAVNLLLATWFIWLLFGMTRVPFSAGPPLGSTAPDVTLTAPDARPVRLADFRGKPLLLVFYRGHW